MCLISVCNLITGLSCSSLQPIAMHLLYSLGRDSLTAPVLCYEKSLHDIAKTGLRAVAGGELAAIVVSLC